MQKLLLPALFACCLCFGQSLQTLNENELIEAFNQATTEQADFCFELPFEYQKQIIVKADFNGNSYNFLFDTGGYTMLNSLTADQNKLLPYAEQPLQSTDGLTSNAALVEIPRFDLGGLKLKYVTAYRTDFSGSPKLNCMVNGGILGTSIINKYVWQIDSRRNILTLTDNISQVDIKDATKFRVYFNKQGQPYILIRVNGKQEMIMFDTGCAYPLWLGSNDANIMGVNAKKNTTISGSRVETHNGSTDGEIHVFSADYSIGNFSFKQAPAYYRDTNNKLSLLGNAIIKDYIITLNFAEQEIYFEPIRKGNANGWKSHGLTLDTGNGKFYIESVTEGSAADKAGLTPNTIITAINGKELLYTDYCTNREHLDKLIDGDAPITLTLAPGKTVTIKKEYIFTP